MRTRLDVLDLHDGPITSSLPDALRELTPLLMPGHISVVHSTERAPLTLLSHILMVSSLLDQEMSAAFFDTSSNYNTRLIRGLLNNHDATNEILRRILVSRVIDIEQFVSGCGSLRSEGNIRILILDSLTGLLNLSTSPASKARQRNLKAMIQEIRKTVNRQLSFALLTAHSTKDWTSGETRAMGGYVLSHSVDSIMEIERLITGADLYRMKIIKRSTSNHPRSIVFNSKELLSNQLQEE